MENRVDVRLNAEVPSEYGCPGKSFDIVRASREDIEEGRKLYWSIYIAKDGKFPVWLCDHERGALGEALYNAHVIAGFGNAVVRVELPSGDHEAGPALHELPVWWANFCHKVGRLVRAEVGE